VSASDYLSRVRAGFSGQSHVPYWVISSSFFRRSVLFYLVRRCSSQPALPDSAGIAKGVLPPRFRPRAHPSSLFLLVFLWLFFKLLDSSLCLRSRSTPNCPIERKSLENVGLVCRLWMMLGAFFLAGIALFAVGRPFFGSLHHPRCDHGPVLWIRLFGLAPHLVGARTSNASRSV